MTENGVAAGALAVKEEVADFCRKDVGRSREFGGLEVTVKLPSCHPHRNYIEESYQWAYPSVFCHSAACATFIVIRDPPPTEEIQRL